MTLGLEVITEPTVRPRGDRCDKIVELMKKPVPQRLEDGEAEAMLQEILQEAFDAGRNHEQNQGLLSLAEVVQEQPAPHEAPKLDLKSNLPPLPKLNTPTDFDNDTPVDTPIDRLIHDGCPSLESGGNESLFMSQVKNALEYAIRNYSAPIGQ